MTVQVYSGSRPGRPWLLLVLASGVLIGMLGLAWFQVYMSRALGPERQVGDTPIYLRLPLDWRPDPNRKNTFVLPHEDRGSRLIRVELLRLPTFRSLSSVMTRLRLDDPETHRRPPTPAPIGRFGGYEVQELRVIRVRGRNTLLERLVRFTCLPDGHLIYLEYEPLGDLRPADFDIMDQVCQTVRVELPGLAGTAQERVTAAGVELPLGDDWVVVRPGLEQVAGVHCGGGEDGTPRWALSIFRTWLAHGREPRDLLADFAAEFWLAWELDDHVRESRRSDGTTTYLLQHPEIGLSDEAIPGVAVVTAPDAPPAMVYVCAGQGDARDAITITERVLQEIELGPVADMPRIAVAERSGVDFARILREHGPVGRWGREPVEEEYIGQTPYGTELVQIQRAAVGRNPRRGYEGSQRHWFGEQQTRKPDRTILWMLAGDGSYRWNAEQFSGTRAYEAIERQTEPGGTIRREVAFLREAPRVWQFEPGTGFVPPPVESVVVGWVAREEAVTAIIEVSSSLGPGTHTLLLRSLPPDGSWPRALVQQDYWPLGMIAAFDDDAGVTQYEKTPTAVFRRVEGDQRRSGRRSRR